ncbi:MAG: MMPL family transporter, partial [Candidatus Aminicenantes bacterium]|nr:MMPL family transporter [Candidatus Aminicenantes bacterium]
MVYKWIAAVVRHRVFVLAAAALLTVVAAAGLPRLRFYNKLFDWLPGNDAQLALYHETSATFSANNIVLVLAKPKAGVFTAETLEKIRDLTENLENRPEIFSVTSLSSVADIKKIDGGVEVRDFLDAIPADPEGLRALEALARSKDRYVGQVLSEDGEWFALSVFISDKVETIAAVEDIVIPEAESALGGTMDVYFTGMPTDGHFINLHSRRDLVFLVPVMLAAIVLILYWNLRTWRGLLPPILVVVLANVWLFGLIGWSGRPMTIITPAAPVLLLALGSAYGLYVVNKIRSDVESGAAAKAPDRKAAVIASAAAVAVPILYAAGTDIISFLTFRGVKLSLIADFGVFSAIGLFFAALLAVTLLPALAAAVDFGKMHSVETKSGLTRFLDKAARRIVRRPGRIVAFFAVLMAAGLIGIPRVFREVGMAGFYTKTSMPRRAMDAANLHFNGAYPASFYFEADAVRDPALLRLIRRSESFLAGLPKVNKPLGVPDLIEELNDSMNDRRALPETRAGVENLWLFLEGRGELTPLITSDGRQTIVFAKLADSTTDFNQTLYRRAEDYFRREAELRPVWVEMNGLTASEADSVRRAEAGFLAEELSWAAQDKGGPAPDVRSIENALLTGLKKTLPAEEAGRAIGGKIRAYCFSPSFPFEAGERDLEAIVGAWTRLAAASTGFEISEPEAVAVVKKQIKPAEYDDGLAADAAASAAYLVRETAENLRVGLLREELGRVLPPGSTRFKQRADSILYDLVDNLAVVPAA